MCSNKAVSNFRGVFQKCNKNKKEGAIAGESFLNILGKKRTWGKI